MAKINLTTAILLSSTGLVSGVVTTKRETQPYFRRRYPSKKLTARQRVTVTAFTMVDGAWRHLQLPVRADWNAYRRWENKFGYNQFQRINIPRAIANLPLILDPANIP